MFQDFLLKLGLSATNLSPYLEGIISILSIEQTQPVGYLKVMVTYGNKKLARMVRTIFLVLPLITLYHYVIGRPTLAKVGAVASTVHLKMKFHSLTGKLLTIPANFNSVERCQHFALKGTQHRLKDIPGPPPSAGKVFLTEVDARYDSDNSEEVDDKLTREIKRKNKHPEPQGEFIEATLKDDPAKTVKLGDELPQAVREILITCLRHSSNLFAWFTSKLHGIPLEVVCHHLAVNLDAKYVA